MSLIGSSSSSSSSVSIFGSSSSELCPSPSVSFLSLLESELLSEVLLLELLFCSLSEVELSFSSDELFLFPQSL